MMQPCFSGGSGWLFSKTFFLAVASCSSVHSTLSLMVRNPNYPKATWHTKTLSVLKYLKIWHFHSDWWWVVSRCNKICKVLWHVARTFLHKSLLHVKDVLNNSVFRYERLTNQVQRNTWQSFYECYSATSSTHVPWLHCRRNPYSVNVILSVNIMLC